MNNVVGQISLYENLPEGEKPVELARTEIMEQLKKYRKKKHTLEEQFQNILTPQVIVDMENVSITEIWQRDSGNVLDTP